MRKREAFSRYHPVINFLFYFGTLVGGMFILHPAYLICSVVCAFCYYLTIRGRDGWRFLAGMLPLFAGVALINPLFNTQGEHVLFTWLQGRPYTLEALFYGMALAAMVLSVWCWFRSYNEVMTSDKFLYLFGPLLPAASLILTMVLRLIPNYQKKIRQIEGARQGVGKYASGGSKTERLQQGMTVLSAMMSWSLEGGIMMADSMKSRGYGSVKKRTSFSMYRFALRDKVLLGWMIFLLAALGWCGVHGGMSAAYTPGLEIAGAKNGYVTAGVLAYGLFLAIPTFVNILEEWTWHILRSKI